MSVHAITHSSYLQTVTSNAFEDDTMPRPPRRTDITGTLISYSRCLSVPWRTGQRVGRTIYAVDAHAERLICVADTPRLADHIVQTHNAALQARTVIERI